MIKIGRHNRLMLNVGVLNTRSVCNKAITVKGYVPQNDIDLCVLTETWLKRSHKSVLADFIPNVYTLHQIPRPSGRGCEVTILHKDSLSMIATECQTYTSFEYIEWKFTCRSSSFNFAPIYRWPSSSKNSELVPCFIDDFGESFESVLVSHSKLIICGDLNIHVDNCSLPDRQMFKTLIHSTGLQQHVTTPTHNSGHILNIVLTIVWDHFLPLCAWLPHLRSLQCHCGAQLLKTSTSKERNPI